MEIQEWVRSEGSSQNTWHCSPALSSAGGRWGWGPASQYPPQLCVTPHASALQAARCSSTPLAAPMAALPLVPVHQVCGDPLLLASPSSLPSPAPAFVPVAPSAWTFSQAPLHLLHPLTIPSMFGLKVSTS